MFPALLHGADGLGLLRFQLTATPAAGQAPFGACWPQLTECSCGGLGGALQSPNLTLHRSRHIATQPDPFGMSQAGDQHGPGTIRSFIAFHAASEDQVVAYAEAADISGHGKRAIALNAVDRGMRAAEPARALVGEDAFAQHLVGFRLVRKLLRLPRAAAYEVVTEVMFETLHLTRRA